MRHMIEVEQRHEVLRRAPEMALSGKFDNAHEIATSLRRQGIDVRLFFSRATCEWLDALCQNALSEIAVTDER